MTDLTPQHDETHRKDDDRTQNSVEAPAYFDQALFDLHYHLLAVRIQGLPPMPNPENYGITVDHLGNVTRIESPV